MELPVRAADYLAHMEPVAFAPLPVAEPVAPEQAETAASKLCLWVKQGMPGTFQQACSAASCSTSWGKVDLGKGCLQLASLQGRACVSLHLSGQRPAVFIKCGYCDASASDNSNYLPDSIVYTVTLPSLCSHRGLGLALSTSQLSGHSWTNTHAVWDVEK